MNPTINLVVFDLLEAVVTLYPANADGTPQLASPVWSGSVAERLTARGTWIKQETRPSGAKHPRQHPLIPQYQIEIGRVFVIDQTASGLNTGFAPDYTRYVLDIVWTDEATQQWHRRTFYGVTIADQEWSARDIESGLIEDQTFDAKYFTASSGAPATPPPAISNTLPYYVQYTDAAGSLLLYTYDPGTKLFTAQADTTGCATIGYASGAFGIQFSGDSLPVVATSGALSLAYRNPAVYRNANTYRQQMLVVNGSVVSGVAPGGAANYPRLDFFYGAQRIATVTRAGVFEVDYDEASVTLDPITDGQFAILCNGSVVALIGSGSLSATNFQVSA